MPSIVISYRRSDTGQITGRIFDRLKDRFGRRHVFLDIDAIPFGKDFREHIREHLDKCDVMLAVIGHHWVDGGEARDRLADPNDWIRTEVETAFRELKPVVPVLIDDAELPAAGTLPQDMQPIAYLQAARLDSGVDFDAHMERLIHSLEQIEAEKPRGPVAAWLHAIGRPFRRAWDRIGPVHRPYVISAVVPVLIAVIAVGAWQYWPHPTRDTTDKDDDPISLTNDLNVPVSSLGRAAVALQGDAQMDAVTSADVAAILTTHQTNPVAGIDTGSGDPIVRGKIAIGSAKFLWFSIALSRCDTQKRCRSMTFRANFKPHFALSRGQIYGYNRGRLFHADEVPDGTIDLSRNEMMQGGMLRSHLDSVIGEWIAAVKNFGVDLLSSKDAPGGG